MRRDITGAQKVYPALHLVYQGSYTIPKRRSSFTAEDAAASALAERQSLIEATTKDSEAASKLVRDSIAKV